MILLGESVAKRDRRPEHQAHSKAARDSHSNSRCGQCEIFGVQRPHMVQNARENLGKKI